MDANGIPVLSESGVSKLHEDLLLGPYGYADDVRRMAPEVLAGGPFTKPSDVYAFACMGLGTYQITEKAKNILIAMCLAEVLTSGRPFNQYGRPSEVILALERGESPAGSHPQSSLTPSLMSIFSRSWNNRAENRPDISEVLRTISPANRAPRLDVAVNDDVRAPRQIGGPIPLAYSPMTRSAPPIGTQLLIAVVLVY